MDATSRPELGRLPDRDLVLAFQAGDEDAYDEVYRRYEERVRQICFRMLRNPEDVDEAAQEAFVKAYQALERFNGRYQLGAWLSRIATNVCLDHLRARSRGAEVIVLPPDVEYREPEGGPEERVAGNGAMVGEALTELQPLHAEALRLRVQGLSHEEMARRLQMTPQQVKALLHRARRSFRKAWERTEALVFAPVLWLRSSFNRADEASRTGMHAPGLAAAGHSAGAVVADKMAASVIVVVALTTFTGGGPPPAEQRSERQRTAREELKLVAPARDRGVATAVAAATTATREAAPAVGVSLPAKDDLQKIKRAVKATTQGPNEVEHKDDDPDETPGPGKKGLESIRETVRKAEKTLDELPD